MPIEIRELHIKSTLAAPAAVAHVMFHPEGTPVRAKANLRLQKSVYSSAQDFAAGLRTLGITPGMALELVVGTAPQSAAPGPPAPHVPVPLPGNPSPPKPAPRLPVIFGPVPLPQGAAGDREVAALETAVRRAGYGNLTLKRGRF